MEQRDACLGLCRAFVAALGWEWTIIPTSQTQSLSDRYRFTELLLRLVNIEFEVLFAFYLRKKPSSSSSSSREEISFSSATPPPPTTTSSTTSSSSSSESLLSSLRIEGDSNRMKFRLSTCSDLLEHAVLFLSSSYFLSD